MRWDESPRFLLLASLASAVLSAALSFAAFVRHALDYLPGDRHNNVLYPLGSMQSL